MVAAETLVVDVPACVALVPCPVDGLALVVVETWPPGVLDLVETWAEDVFTCVVFDAFPAGVLTWVVVETAGAAILVVVAA